jgi:hypothetical protein
VTAWCLEVHDLVIAKLAANRPHDHEFVEEAIRSGLAMRDDFVAALSFSLPAIASGSENDSLV